jgi:hypothetical protein
MNASSAHWPNDHTRREIDCAAAPRSLILDPGNPVDRWTMVTRVGTASRRGALSLTVALALAWPARAQAAAPEPERSASETSAAPSPAAKVDLDLSALEPIDPSVRADLAKQIHASVEPIVREHGLDPEKIHIDVAWRDADQFDYTVDIEFAEHDRVAARKHEISSGPNTEQGELAELIAANLGRFLDEWEGERAALQPAPDSRPSPIVDPGPSELPRPRALGRVGWTGVGLLIAGVGVAATGGALLGVDRTPHPDRATQLRDWQPAGYGLLATGGALLVTGVVMVVVDAVPRARARRSAKNAAVTPTLGPTHAGAVLKFRF